MLRPVELVKSVPLWHEQGGVTNILRGEKIARSANKQANLKRNNPHWLIALARTKEEKECSGDIE